MLWRVFLLLLPFVLAPVAASPQAALGAQSGEVRLEGRVVKQGSGVPGVEVSLHRVTRESAGVLERTRTGGTGGFTFSIAAADTVAFAVYFTTADYLGVRYFGPALHPGEPAGDYALEVFDTATANPAAARVRLLRREVMLVPAASGGWEVNEAVQIRNEEPHTLVAGSGPAAWEFSIPEGVEAFEVGDGEIVPADVRRMGSRVFLLGPLQPGSRDLLLRYRLGAGQNTLRLPVDRPTGSLTVYVRQPSPPVTVQGLTAGEPLSAEGETFLRFSATDPPPGEDLTVAWDAPREPLLDPVSIAIGVVSLLLAVGAGAALRRRGASDPPPAPSAHPDTREAEPLAAGAREPGE